MNTEWSKLTIQVRMMVNALGGVHFALGLAVIAGGPVRFAPPTYTPLHELVNGNIWIYGATLVVAGGLMLSHRVQAVIVGLAIGWLSSCLWAALFGYAVYKFPTAGTTAPVAYGGYALLDVVFMVKIWLYRREFRNRR